MNPPKGDPMIKELLQQNRSYRRFHQNHPIAEETLHQLIDLTRYTPSALNRQSLRYIISCGEKKNSTIFPSLGWAGYLKEWNGPAEGERPTAYIVILGDRTLNHDSRWGDHTVAAHTILLGATEKGLGGCIIGNINNKKLTETLNLSPDHEILLVVALGKPNETVIIEPVDETGSIRYWHDEEGNHHVPKRSLTDLILDK